MAKKSRCGSSKKILPLLPRCVLQRVDIQDVINRGVEVVGVGTSSAGSHNAARRLPAGRCGRLCAMAFLASAGCFWRAGPEKPEGDVPGSVSFTGTLPSGVRERNYMPGLAGGITCRDWQKKLRAGTGRRNYMPGRRMVRGMASGWAAQKAGASETTQAR